MFVPTFGPSIDTCWPFNVIIFTYNCLCWPVCIQFTPTFGPWPFKHLKPHEGRQIFDTWDGGWRKSLEGALGAGQRRRIRFLICSHPPSDLHLPWAMAGQELSELLEPPSYEAMVIPAVAKGVTADCCLYWRVRGAPALQSLCV